ncbi:hypothetical protein FME95_01550 [Reinekea thalattae]|uniref:Uncharacterized protein n=2 Tax=Reinekea thalattae TaxID=2593301 RepID=A0A5C8Z7J3_9GAMM|nr:hypothetical protein FME95_01550 [Reinekea thalattae]
MNAAIIYMIAFLGFWLCLWRAVSYLPWRLVRWWIHWVYLCVVLTPWKGTEPEIFYAPAIIVGAFDFLDVGPTGAMKALLPMIAALVGGSLFLVLVAIVGRHLRMKKAGQQSEQEESAVG